MGSGIDGKGTSPNYRDASKRSAKSRQCPECGRKSAMVFYSDELTFGSSCRWCGYSTIRVRQ